MRFLIHLAIWLAMPLFIASLAHAQEIDVKRTETFRQIKAHIDGVPAIDTHDHLRPFDALQGKAPTPEGMGMTLYGIWKNSYYTWNSPLLPWPESGKFEDWWPAAKTSFANARAMGFYRYQLPAFTDLYGIDFETMTDGEAKALNDSIFRNYQNADWIAEVVTRRANIELLFIDPYWNRLEQAHAYPFTVAVLNVTRLLRGFSPAEYPGGIDSPYRWAAEHDLPIATLDDYLAVVRHFLTTGQAAGGICLKTTSAYERALDFENAPRERAEKAWGRAANQLAAEDVKAFEDYVMWRLAGLSAELDLPFQIHTGDARIQGSNPMNLLPLIEGNPDTKFILFHGGYPWIGETGAIMMRHSKHVWVDSNWLPTISYTMAKRAYQEWLEVMPSDRIMWGSDAHHAEGVYAAAEVTRRCLAEALSEKVERGELRIDAALHIGAQIMRENALALFPRLKDRLWKPESARN